MAKLKYQRILLKISGEGLSGTGKHGINAQAIETLANQIANLRQLGVQTAVVVGAGNLIRGKTLSQQSPVHRVTADQMGMLATIINAIGLQDVLESKGVSTRVMSAIDMPAICEPFIRRRAIRHLEHNRVIILAGGTGNPYFTTDTCAALRASEIQANVLVKATKVDGVYSSDPVKNSNAKRYDHLSYAEVLEQNLEIMDQSAILMCQENSIDIIVCDLMNTGTVQKVAMGEQAGTLISGQ